MLLPSLFLHHVPLAAVTASASADGGALCGDGLRFVLNGGRPHGALVKGAPNQVGPPKAILIIAPSKKEEQSMQASLLLLLLLLTL